MKENKYKKGEKPKIFNKDAHLSLVEVIVIIWAI